MTIQDVPNNQSVKTFRGKSLRLIIALFGLNMILFFANLVFGSIPIPFSEILETLVSPTAETESISRLIILTSRLPQAITALLTGAALSVAGLLMQTLFRNPLAGPGILGISAGASMGVAILTLLGGASSLVLISSYLQQFSIVIAAFAGAFSTLGLVLLFARFVKSNVSLLIIGLMIGYAVSSFIGFLQFISQEQQVHSFVIWGLGSFSQVSMHQMTLFAGLILSGIIASFFFVKPLNLMLLGEHYATNLGVNVKKLRVSLIVIAGLLTAVATAYTGPIAFIGLAVPHLSRMIFKTSEHKILLPGIILTGMAIALGCNLIARLPSLEQAIPINTVTSLFGAPLVIWFLIKNNRINMSAS